MADLQSISAMRVAEAFMGCWNRNFAGNHGVGRLIGGAW